MEKTSSYVTDTHSLIWFVTGNPSLSETAKQVFLNPENRIYVPVLVLVEANYLRQKGKIGCGGMDLKTDIASMENWAIVDFTLDLLDYCPGELNIHDEMICAYARKEGLPVITKDREIEAASGVKTVW